MMIAFRQVCLTLALLIELRDGLVVCWSLYLCLRGVNDEYRFRDVEQPGVFRWNCRKVVPE